MMLHLEICVYASMLLQLISLIVLFLHAKKLGDIKERIILNHHEQSRNAEKDIHVDLHNRLAQLQQTNYARKYPRR